VGIAVSLGHLIIQGYYIFFRYAVQALQDKLETRLRDSMMKWRKRQRTQWNRYCAATMRKLLPRLEEATWNPADTAASPDHWQGLQQILASHKVTWLSLFLIFHNRDMKKLG